MPTDLITRLRALLWEWRTRADAERIAAEGQPQRERELLEHSADGYYACAAELEAELDDLAAALQGPETAPACTKGET